MKYFIKKILILGFAVVAHMSWASGIPQCISSLLAEMRETGATVRGGYNSAHGVFLVGIGRTRYRHGAVSKSREIAQMHAVKAVTEALGQAFRAKDVVALQMSATDDSSEAKAFVSSMTESSIDQLVKGIQVVSSGKNAEGEMEVAVYLTSKMADYTSTLLEMQKQWGSSGVVKAVGMGMERRIAEMNALRSAVEQVAGTLVVGKVSMNEREELHKRLATSAGALVEEYRVISETKVEMEFRIEIVARVSKRKLYDSYKSYFKTLDNPVFYIEATDRALSRNFTQFFIDKGMQISENRDIAQYVIRLDGRYRDRPTPGNADSMGTMLSLAIEIVSIDGTRVLLKMNEKKAKDSEVLSREQRIEEVSRTIFEKIHKRLHQAIHDMVIKMIDDADTTPVETLDSGTGF